MPRSYPGRGLAPESHVLPARSVPALPGHTRPTRRFWKRYFPLPCPASRHWCRRNTTDFMYFTPTTLKEPRSARTMQMGRGDKAAEAAGGPALPAAAAGQQRPPPPGLPPARAAGPARRVRGGLGPSAWPVGPWPRHGRSSVHHHPLTPSRPPCAARTLGTGNAPSRRAGSRRCLDARTEAPSPVPEGQQGALESGWGTGAPGGSVSSSPARACGAQWAGWPRPGDVGRSSRAWPHRCHHVPVSPPPQPRPASPEATPGSPCPPDAAPSRGQGTTPVSPGLCRVGAFETALWGWSCSFLRGSTPAAGRGQRAARTALPGTPRPEAFPDPEAGRCG